MQKTLFSLLILPIAAMLVAAPYDPNLAAGLETDPIAIIDDKVNAMTGDFLLETEEIYVPGRDPLSLKSTYLSGDGTGEFSGWTFVPHARLILRPGRKKKSKTTIDAYEPNGTCLRFVEEAKDRFNLIPPIGIANTARGVISGRTNLHNTSLTTPRGLHLILNAADGTIRHYKRSYVNNYMHLYTLESEQLPNGSKRQYEYDNEHRIAKVTSFGASYSEPSAWIAFTYLGKQGKLGDFFVTTSDGQEIAFSFASRKEGKKERAFYLTEALGGILGDREYTYKAPDGPFSHRVTSVKFGTGHCAKVKYFPSSYNSEFSRGRVHTLKQPAGENGEELITHSFQYSMLRKRDGEQFVYKGRGHTKVTQADGSVIRYGYGKLLLPEKVEYFNPDGSLDHAYIMSWSSRGELRQKTYTDGEGKRVWMRTIQYDTFGNPIIETFAGDLTGEGEWEEEVISRRYDKQNRLIETVYPNGKKITCTYHANTDLPTALLLWCNDSLLKRQFSFYDATGLLTRIAIDDGTSPIADDLTGVSFRKITAYEGGTYRPSAIEERVWDGVSGDERLMKRTLFSYENATSKATVYDGNGRKLRTTEQTLDRKGRVLREVDPFGAVTSTTYDQRGHLLRRQIAGMEPREFTCDLMGQLVAVSRGNYTSFFSNGINTYQFSDTRGYSCNLKFSPFGQLEEKEFPPTRSPDGTPMPVKWCYTYLNKCCVKEIDPDGGITTTKYNSRRQITEQIFPNGESKTFRYNIDGSLRSELERDGTLKLYERDVLGRPTRIETFDKEGSPIGEEELIWNSFFLLEKKISGDTTYAAKYNSAGHKVEEQIGNTIRSFYYDDLGRLVSEEEEGKSSFYTYDEADRVVEKISEGKTETFTYTPWGRVASISTTSDSGETEYRYGYDACGKLTSITYPSGDVLTLERDNIAEEGIRPYSRRRYHLPNGSIAEEWRDLEGRLIYRKTPQGSNTYHYTPGGRLFRLEGENATVNYSEEGLPIEKITAAGTYKCTYTDEKQRELLSLPSGVDIRYRYTADGKLTELIASDGSIHYTAHYDPHGRLVKYHDAITGHSGGKTYNRGGLCTSETLLNGQTLTSGYDNAGNRICLTYPDDSKTYFRWRDGQLIEVVRHMADDLFEYRHKLLHYNRDAFPIVQRLPQSFGELQFSKDRKGAYTQWSSRAAGTLDQQPVMGLLTASSQEPYTITCDALGRIVEIKFSNKEILYTYDLWNRRVGKIVTSLTPLGWSITEHLSFLYDGDKEIGTYDETDKWVKQLKILADRPINGGDSAIAYELENLPYIPLFDGEGNSYKLLSLSREKLMESYTYDENGQAQIKDYWGSILTESKAGNPWIYKAARKDSETGLYYIKGRYYDPEKGAYVTPPLDPMKVDEVAPLSLPLPKVETPKAEEHNLEEGLEIPYSMVTGAVSKPCGSSIPKI